MPPSRLAWLAACCLLVCSVDAQTCDAGFSGPDGGPCAPCAAGQFKDATGPGACSSCRAYSHSPAGSVSGTACLCNAGPPGSDPCPPQLTCVACAQGDYMAQGTAQCTRCPNNASTVAAVNATHIEDCRCAEGHFNVSHECHECVRGEFKTAPGDVPCAVCHDNAHTPRTGAALATDCVCEPGYFEAAALACAACPPGTAKAGPGNEACGECAADVFCVLGSVAPVPCPDNSTSAGGSDEFTDCHCEPGFSHDAERECVLCAPGKFQPQSDQPECAGCPENTFLPSSGASHVAQCLACDPNARSEAASLAATQCLCTAGHSGAPSEPCVACGPGTFRSDMGEYICTACDADSYNEHHGSVDVVACLACPGNTSTAGLQRAGLALACVCDPGFASALAPGASRFTCSPCAAGTFQTGSNATRCELCGPGTYGTAAMAASADACLACADGHFTTDDAQTVCLACPADTWQNVSVLGVKATLCSACPAHSSHDGLGSVDVNLCVCAPGFVGRGVGAGYHCAACDAGFSCPGNRTQTPCPQNTWSAAGYAVCTDCAALSATAPASPQHRVQECQCVPGAEGSFDANCTLCAPGSVRDAFAAGPAHCRPCAPDSYVFLPGQTQCSACPAHAHSPPGSDNRTDCVCHPGFFGADGSACEVCLPGFYCPGGSTLNPCMSNSQSLDGSARLVNCTCRPGHFSSAPGERCDACTVDHYCPGSVHIYGCPHNSTSDWLADAVDKCVCDPGHWRGCAGNATGYFDEHSRPCVVDHSQPCVACGSDTFCLNNTLTHCPTHSRAPRGSSDEDDCVCDGGFVETHHP